MRAVLVGIGKDYHLVIFKVGYIKIHINTGTQRRNYGAELLICKHLIQPLLFHIKRLAAQRQYCLKTAVPALLCRSACGIALHYEQLVLLRASAGAGGQLAYKRRSLQRALFAGYILGLARRHAHPCRLYRLFQHYLPDLGVFQVVKVCGELFRNHRFHRRARLHIAQLCLGLPLELHILHLYGKHGRNTLAEILPLEIIVLFLKHAASAGIIIHYLCKSGFEPGFMSSAL